MGQKEILRKFLKYFKLNKSNNTTSNFMWQTKAVLWEKLIAVNAYI